MDIKHDHRPLEVKHYKTFRKSDVVTKTEITWRIAGSKQMFPKLREVCFATNCDIWNLNALIKIHQNIKHNTVALKSVFVHLSFHSWFDI